MNLPLAIPTGQTLFALLMVRITKYLTIILKKHKKVACKCLQKLTDVSLSISIVPYQHLSNGHVCSVLFLFYRGDCALK